MTLTETISAIRPLCEKSMRAAETRFQSLAIPLGSLGLLEDAVVQLAGAQRTALPEIGQRAAVVFCADNGVVAQGVTQCGPEVTATVTENMDAGKSAVCRMAARLGADVFPVDIGVMREVQGGHILRRKLMHGTRDFTVEPAMTRETCVKAVETGIDLAGFCAVRGYHILCAGEMGIGNTTTAAAVSAAFLGLPPEQVTGRGAGLSGEGLARKTEAVRRGLALHQPDPHDPIGVLAAVGGLDIAGMAGLYLGGALYGGPAVPAREWLHPAVAPVGRARRAAAAGSAGRKALPDGGHAAGRRDGGYGGAGAARPRAHGLPRDGKLRRRRH